MTDRPEFPRPLSDRETEALNFMLDLDDSRLAPLRDQARTASVTGRCSCGCATVDLTVDRSRTKAASVCSPVTDARAKPTDDDADGVLELVLLARDGWLSSLEIVYYRGPIPTEFPATSSFEPPWLHC